MSRCVDCGDGGAVDVERRVEVVEVEAQGQAQKTAIVDCIWTAFTRSKRGL